ncbi:MAG: hypothetical protein GY910_17115 [bacterium]|nr:hypothetical protein [bacterium]
MSQHPIITLVNDRDVKQAKGFRQAAEKLTGVSLEADYQTEVANAPKRSAEDLTHLNVRVGRKAKQRQNNRDEKHLCEAIARAAVAARTDEASGLSLELPTGETLTIVDHCVPIKTAAPDKEKGDADPNAGVEDIPLLAVIGEDRVGVGVLKFLEPDATRSGAGDTPLRLFLQGLAHAASVDANREALVAEIAEATGKTIGQEAPAVIIAASPRYWELCRKREAQKGAGWIRELERIAREIGESIGTEVFFVGLSTDAPPATEASSDAEGSEGTIGWDYDDEGARLAGDVSLEKAWEVGAGKLKPKPKPKKVDPADAIIEADLSRPVRIYGIRESYGPGDRINHKNLGEGVVQGVVGRGKIAVLFGEDKKLLIHERP